MAVRAISSPDEDLPSFLTSVLGLPADHRTILSRSLSQKFEMAITGETSDIREAIAISLVQAFAIAVDINDQSYIQVLRDKLKFDTAALPHGEAIFSPSFYTENRNLIKHVYSVMPVQEKAVDDLLKTTAGDFAIRIRRYTMLNGRNFFADQFTIESGQKDNYLTCYIFINSRKAVVLVPKKYQIAAKSSEILLKKAVFYSTRQRDPPKVDQHLHANLRIITQLLTLVQNFSKPMLKYCTKLLARLEETRLTLHLNGGDLSVARKSMKEIVSELEGADFGDGGDAPLRAMKDLLGRDNIEKPCDACGGISADIDLGCGHSFCANCVRNAIPADFLNVRGELKFPIPCLHTHACPTGIITIDDLRRMDEKFYLTKLDEVEKKCNLRMCLACNRLHALTSFEQLRCGHYICKFCISTNYSIDLKCPVDNKGAFRPETSYDSLQDACPWCQNMFYYKHTINFSCVLPYEMDLFAGHPPFCNGCMEKSLSQGFCCQSHRLTPDEIEYVTANLIFQAHCHRQPTLYVNLIRQTSCPHKICRDCVLKSNMTVCPECRTPFNPESMPECGTCHNPAADLQLRCEHFIHSGCVEKLVGHHAGKNWAGCMACGDYISPAYILPKLANNVPSHTAFNDAFGYSFNFKCPFPNGNIRRISLSERKAIWHTCDCHRKTMCPLCLEEYKEEFKDRPHECRYITIRANVDGMLEMKQEVMQCPVCQLPEEWVGAEYTQCKRCDPPTYYAPCCSALYVSIYFHGAGWHRPNCLKYRNDPPLPSAAFCTSCQAIQAVCPKPRQLQRPRLIGPNEGVN